MPRALKVSRAKFAEMWANQQMTSAQIAEAIGTKRSSTVSNFAKAFGLPPRKPGPKPLIDFALFRRMWIAGVGVEEMGRVFGISKSRVSQEARRADLPRPQIVQPWWFGEPFFKATGFYLRGLAPLVATDRLTPPKAGTDAHKAWSAVHRAPPGPDRWKFRSRTFAGVAAACADQWGGPPAQLSLFGGL